MVPMKGYLINAELRERDPPTVSSECEHEPPPMERSLSARPWAVQLTCVTSFLCTVIPGLQVRKLRHRAMKSLAEVPMAGK